MKTYLLPTTDLPLSRLGYGCMSIGGRWDNSPLLAGDYAKAERAVMTAYESGLTLFDHADIYMQGKSEEVFGALLHKMPSWREQIVLQTKCGIRFADDPQPGVPARYDFSYAHLVQSAENSLRRLHTDRLDILLLHRPDALAEPSEIARAFDALHTAGKVRYFGVSNHTPAQIDLLKKHLRQPILVNQIEISLLHHQTISDGILANQRGAVYTGVAGLLDYCRLNNILVQAWGPLANGRLVAATTETDTAQVAALIARLAEAKRTSREAIALAWLLRHPAGIQPIIGTTNPERLRACALADDVELSREEWYLLLQTARGAGVP